MYLGIDIGGTTIKIGLFDKELNLIEKHEIASRKGMDLLEDLVSEINVNYEIDKIDGIGIGIPGFVGEDGYLKDAFNIGLHNINLPEYFKRELNVKCVVLNDASAATLGEYWALNNPDIKDMILITLGTGVGGGIIINGEIYFGKNGYAGEIGHMVVDNKYNFECGCSNIGCLETMSSSIGFNNLYQYYKDQYAMSRLFDYEKVNVKEIMDSAKLGDDLALKIVDEALYSLALGIHNLVAVLNPDTIIIGGGISKAQEFFLNNLNSQFDKVTIPIFKDLDLRLALLENDAGMYGLANYAKIRTSK